MLIKKQSVHDDRSLIQLKLGKSESDGLKIQQRKDHKRDVEEY